MDTQEKVEKMLKKSETIINAGNKTNNKSVLFARRCPICNLLVGYLDRRCSRCGYKL